MAGPNDKAYVFKRDYRAGARLDLQHYHWRDTVGHLIHPQIQFDKEDVQILDIGCGTGVWLTDVSRMLSSSAMLTGTDVNLDQCPPRVWLPSNLSFLSWSIFDEPPENLVERFDLVHLQLLCFVIKDSELIPTLRRVMKTVKKGGWIQWCEWDHPSNTIVKVDSGAPSLSLENLLGQIRQGITHPTWIAGLENRFREQHLASVQQFRYMPSFDNLPSMMAVILMGIEELIANKDQGTAKELEELLAHAAAEVSNGVAWLGPSVEVIGRRAW